MKKLELAVKRWEEVRKLPEDRMKEQRWQTVLNNIDVAHRQRHQKSCTVWLTAEPGSKLMDRSRDARWLGDFILMKLAEMNFPCQYLWRLNPERTVVYTGVQINELRPVRVKHQYISVEFTPKRRTKTPSR